MTNSDAVRGNVSSLENSLNDVRLFSVWLKRVEAAAHESETKLDATETIHKRGCGKFESNRLSLGRTRCNHGGYFLSVHLTKRLRGVLCVHDLSMTAEKTGRWRKAGCRCKVSANSKMAR